MKPEVARALDRWILEPPELEDEEADSQGNCRRPGPHGCGSCPGCSDWGDQELERRRDKEMEEMENNERKKTPDI